MPGEVFDLSMSVNDVLNAFGIRVKDFEDFGFHDANIPREAVLETIADHGLEAAYTDNEDVYYDVLSALSDAQVSGTENNYNRAKAGVVEQVLEIFKNYGAVDYACDGETGLQHVSKSVVGITDFDVNVPTDSVSITFDRDIVHVIGYMLDCDGMFGVSCEDVEAMATSEPLAVVSKYVESHLHWLETHFECHGERKPEMSFDEGFDSQFFKDMMSDVVKSYER